MRSIQRITLLMGILFFISCDRQDKAPYFTVLSSEQTGITFVNTVENREDFNIFLYRNFYNGGGVGIGDVNNDGLPDIYLTANMSSNKLYLNKGDLTFEDITASAKVASENKWSTGVTMIDINNDGLLDIYVSNAGYIKGTDQKNELYINNGDLTFSEQASAYGLDNNGYSTHAAFFDYDNDGDLDVYILNNSFMPVNTLNYSNKRELKAEDWPVKDFLKGGGDKLMRNDNGVFTNVTDEAGIYSSLIGFGLGVTLGDINNDGWQDIYISNDFFERDYLYINQRDGSFSEEIKNYTDHISSFSMGADMADVNNDTHQDIFVTDMLPADDQRLKTTTSFEPYSTYKLKLDRDFYHQFMQNTLQLNVDGDYFKEVARYAGVSASDWSWGALIFDVNNDGLKDIFISNGIYHDVTDQDFVDFFADEVIQRMAITGEKEQVESIIEKMPSRPIRNKLFVNKGSLKFEDHSGIWSPSFSNGSAYGDLDNDGDLDLVVNNVNQEVLVLRNNSSNQYLKVKLVGPAQNKRAIGAKVLAFVGDQQFKLEQVPSRGFQSSVDYTLVFGLDTLKKIDSLEVWWPGQTHQVIYEVAAGQTITLDHKNSERPKDLLDKKSSKQLLHKLEIDTFSSHEEDEFVDFYKEGLVIKGVSKEGPDMAIADLNNDGFDDLYVTGASGQQGRLYVYSDGTYKELPQDIFKKHDFFEDSEAVFFDVDADNDLDLFVGSGGNHRYIGSVEMQDRLYINDGLGNYQLQPGAFPNNGYNTAVAVPLDYDHDGHLDLFVGSRSVPGDYGRIPKSYIYRNKGTGTFEDVTSKVFPQLVDYGLITDATLADVDNDNIFELVIVGEWMEPLVVDLTDSQKMRLKNTSLSRFKGWWNCVETGDLDNDGDIDLILGNRGDNFYFTGDEDHIVKLWWHDFDNNGTFEKIITHHLDGKDVTVHLKKELTDQIVSLKKQSLKHSEFAEKSIQDLFDRSVLAEAKVLEANYFSSCIALNDGEGNFSINVLPYQAQLSSIRDVLVHDLNRDNLLDIIVVGNDYDFLPQYGRLDASRGDVLINKGLAKFEILSPSQSGFTIRGQGRSIKSITVGQKNILAVLINNEKPQFFEIDDQ